MVFELDTNQSQYHHHYRFHRNAIDKSKAKGEVKLFLMLRMQRHERINWIVRASYHFGRSAKARKKRRVMSEQKDKKRSRQAVGAVKHGNQSGFEPNRRWRQKKKKKKWRIFLYVDFASSSSIAFYSIHFMWETGINLLRGARQGSWRTQWQFHIQWCDLQSSANLSTTRRGELST